MTCDEVRGNLALYVDSELPGGDLAAFESHLRNCAGCAAEALGQLQTKRAIRTAGTRYVPSPEFRLRMQQSIHAKKSNSRLTPWFRFPFPRLVMTAVAALVLVASVTVWMGYSGRERELTEIADMHVTELASANPVDVVSTDRHTVKPWFAGKLPFSFNLPELQNSEFTLTGGRVTYFEHSPGAQLLFNLRKHQLSVFIFKDDAGGLTPQIGMSTATRLSLHIESWHEGGLRYFIVGDAPASDVHALGELLRNAARS
jgi:anti-sigma factor RsiW